MNGKNGGIGLWLAVGVGGVVAGLSVHTPLLWAFGVLGLVPLFHALAKDLPPFRAGSVFGISYLGASFLEFWTVLPLSHLGIEFPYDALLIGAYWLFLSLFMGVTIGLFAAPYVRFVPQSILAKSLYGASLFVLAEYAATWVYALLLSQGGDIAPHFSATMLGYITSQFDPALSLAPFGGIFILSFTTVAVAILLFEGIRSYADKHAPLTAAAFAIALATIGNTMGLFAERTAETERTVRVALVTTESIVPDYLQRTSEIIESWAKQNEAPDVLIFPEATDFFEHLDIDPAAYSHELFRDRTVFIDTSFSTPGRKAVVTMGPEGTGGSSEKVFFAPFGEYTPRIAQLLLDTASFFGVRPNMRSLGLMPGAARTVEMRDARWGAFSCSEIMSPRLYRKAARDGAEIFANVASHSWFHGSRVVDNRALTMARVRAAESRRFLVIAGDRGTSAVISDRGIVVVRSAPGTNIIAHPIPRRGDTTPYARFGELVLLLPAGFVVLHIARMRLRSRRA